MSAEFELTVPHFWAIEDPDRLPVPPPGWELHPVGTIDGTPFAIAVDPSRHDVAVVAAGGLSPHVADGMSGSDWRRFSRTDSTEIWWRDRRTRPIVHAETAGRSTSAAGFRPVGAGVSL